MTDELDKPIGTQERPKLAAGSVIVSKITIEEFQSKKTSKKFKVVVLHCIHPEADELIKISNIMILSVQGDTKTIKKDAIWYQEDKEGKIDKNCNTVKLMNHYKRFSLRNFENSEVITELDASGFLAIRAY